MSAVVAAAAAKGVAGYSGQVASFIAKSARLFGSAFTENFISAGKGLLTTAGKEADEFVESYTKNGGWAKCLVAGGITISASAMNFTNFLNDGRRVREIASGQSNFYTSRDAASKTWMLSSLGLGASAATIATGFLGTPGSFATKAITAATTAIAAGAVASRSLYKWISIDVPFKPASGLGMLSMNNPIFRVDDPSSPYYMMSNLMEGAVNKRQIDDSKYGELGSGYLEGLKNTFTGVAKQFTA